MYIFRYIKSGLSLRLVNMVGLAVTFASLLLSIAYVRYELSYDRHHEKADRIMRLSQKVEGEDMDVRIYGSAIYSLLSQMPEIETYARVHNQYTCDLEFKGRHFSKYENIFMVNEEFFDVFDVRFVEKEGRKFEEDHVYLSRSYAEYLAAESDEDTMLGKEVVLHMEPAVVAGIYEDFPETSHFRADLLILRSRFAEENLFCYQYLLLKEGTDTDALEGRITYAIEESGIYDRKVSAFLMPLTDIHLHSNHIRELDNNGNILYIYLIICANILLLLIVLFNLWLNQNLILADNGKRHMINRVLGAPDSQVICHEAVYSLLASAVSAAAALLVVWGLKSCGFVEWPLILSDIVVSVLLFIVLTVAVSLLPALKALKMDFSRSAKRVFVMQFAIVTLILVMSLGMGRQMGMVSRIQPGGDSVAVMNVPDNAVMSKLHIFKDELKKSSHIKGVTTVFLLPGNAIRDYASVDVEGLEEPVMMPVFIAGEGFLPFFDLELVAGEGFKEIGFDYETELRMYLFKLLDNEISDRTEDYIINESALPLLGFKDASEAIGKAARMDHSHVGYINSGLIAGVVKDFYYTGTLNRTEPIIMMQRQCFQHCILIDFAEVGPGMEHVREAWNKVYPDYVLSDYRFVDEIYEGIYSDERQAVRLMRAFALICFIITDLGLVVFMAYIVKRRRKEIALRKVNGATAGDIVSMLNRYYIKYILIAFFVAVPVSWFILDRWLQGFAYRITVDWWLFALAALTIILVSVSSVTLQSLRAASANPLDGIRETI